jgi:hypothetical protein
MQVLIILLGGGWATDGAGIQVFSTHFLLLMFSKFMGRAMQRILEQMHCGSCLQFTMASNLKTRFTAESKEALRTIITLIWFECLKMCHFSAIIYCGYV